ncbi:MAG: NAD kinase [Chitinophagales bacterium]|nr:NAD kinase [Chitinophagales bacterium]MCZ2394143.1 NAD kinase [Chitinophagales bacterium]
MNIAIYSRIYKKDHSSHLPELLYALNHLGYKIMVYEPYLKSFHRQIPHLPVLHSFKSHTDLVNNVDLMISIGGDGTLLDTVHFVRNSGIPVAGINIGRLGFLADINKGDINTLISALHSHNYTIENRSLMHVDTSRAIFGEINYGLNEVTLTKTDSSSMIVVHTFLNGEFLNSFWADGLIACTPTGSTAYSLSCGGPIVFPIAHSFVLTPVAPHNLNARPMVIPDNTILSFEVETRAKSYLCSIDSRYKKVERDFKLAIRKESFDFKLLRLSDTSYIKTLRKKLMWGEDTRN